MKTIVDEIGLDAVLGQLAEESAELAQAALKLQRIVMGKNPTPVTMEEAKANLLEEATDVTLCLGELNLVSIPTFNMDTYNAKLERWYKRIEEAKKKVEAEVNEK